MFTTRDIYKFENVVTYFYYPRVFFSQFKWTVLTYFGKKCKKDLAFLLSYVF